MCETRWMSCSKRFALAFIQQWMIMVMSWIIPIKTKVLKIAFTCAHMPHFEYEIWLQYSWSETSSRTVEWTRYETLHPTRLIGNHHTDCRQILYISTSFIPKANKTQPIVRLTSNCRSVFRIHTFDQTLRCLVWKLWQSALIQHWSIILIVYFQNGGWVEPGLDTRDGPALDRAPRTTYTAISYLSSNIPNDRVNRPQKRANTRWPSSATEQPLILTANNVPTRYTYSARLFHVKRSVAFYFPSYSNFTSNGSFRQYRSIYMCIL